MVGIVFNSKDFFHKIFFFLFILAVMALSWKIWTIEKVHLDVLGLPKNLHFGSNVNLFTGGLIFIFLVRGKLFLGEKIVWSDPCFCVITFFRAPQPSIPTNIMRYAAALLHVQHKIRKFSLVLEWLGLTKK